MVKVERRVEWRLNSGLDFEGGKRGLMEVLVRGGSISQGRGKGGKKRGRILLCRAVPGVGSIKKPRKNG